MTMMTGSMAWRRRRPNRGRVDSWWRTSAGTFGSACLSLLCSDQPNPYSHRLSSEKWAKKMLTPTTIQKYQLATASKDRSCYTNSRGRGCWAHRRGLLSGNFLRRRNNGRRGGGRAPKIAPGPLLGQAALERGFVSLKVDGSRGETRETLRKTIY